MICEAEAIVLQSRKYSDSSKIVVLFSKEFGKLSVIAKGAFSSKSKFSGGLEPLSFVHICFYNKPSSNLHLLKSVEIITPLHNMTKNYDCLMSGLLAAEFVSITQIEQFVNADLFEYFLTMLHSTNDSTDFCYSYCVQFLYKLADNLGYLLDLEALGNMNDMKMSNKILKTIKGIETKGYRADVGEFIEIVNYIIKFLSKHLERRLQLRTMNLLQ